jgi:hypothetical protein
MGAITFFQWRPYLDFFTIFSTKYCRVSLLYTFQMLL